MFTAADGPRGTSGAIPGRLAPYRNPPNPPYVPPRPRCARRSSGGGSCSRAAAARVQVSASSSRRGSRRSAIRACRRRPRRDPAAAPVRDRGTAVASIPGEAELLDCGSIDRVPAWRSARRSRPPCHPRSAWSRPTTSGSASPPCRAGRRRRCTARKSDPDASGRAASAAPRVLARRAVPRERLKGDGAIALRPAPFIEASRSTGRRQVALRMTLRHDPERGIGRPDEMLAALADRARCPVEARRSSGSGSLLADAPPWSSPVPRNRGPRRGGQPVAAAEAPQEVVPALGVAGASAVGEPGVADAGRACRRRRASARPRPRSRRGGRPPRGPPSPR